MIKERGKIGSLFLLHYFSFPRKQDSEEFKCFFCCTERRTAKEQKVTNKVSREKVTLVNT